MSAPSSSSSSSVPPSHDDIQELLGAFALDAVDGDERDLVVEHLSTCARCRAEVNAHRETAAMLAHAGARAPDGVWDRIASSLEEPPPPIELQRRQWAEVEAPSGRGAGSGSRRGSRSTGLLAAAAVVIAVLALMVALGGRDEDGGIPSGPRVELASADGRHSAGIVVADGRGVVVDDNLPALPAEQVYQLWGRRGPDLISLGLLGRDPDGEEFVLDEEYEAYAITVEKAGGVVSSEQVPVVSGAVDA
jgi:anti-sigma factor RsiW